jgi:hypothetical protein
VAESIGYTKNIYIELGDEFFNFAGYQLGSGCLVWQAMLGPTATLPQAYAWRSAAMHAAFIAPWQAVGRGSQVRRVFMGQQQNAGRLRAVIDYCVAHGYPVDAAGDSAYMGYQGSPQDYPIGAFDNLDAEQLHDVWEWSLAYYGPNNASAGNAAYVKAHYPNAEYCAYEAGVGSVITPKTPNTLANVAKLRDFFYHPRMRRSSKMAYAKAQSLGYDFITKYNFSDSSAGGIGFQTDWFLALYNGQPAGDGTSNVFYTSVGPPVPSGGNQDLLNSSPALLAWQDWARAFPRTPRVAIDGPLGAVYPGVN